MKFIKIPHLDNPENYDYVKIDNKILQMLKEKKIYYLYQDITTSNNKSHLPLNELEKLIENKEKDIGKKLFTETHMISLVPYVKQSMENNISEAMFAEWLVNFFKTENNTDVYSKYNDACS